MSRSLGNMFSYNISMLFRKAPTHGGPDRLGPTPCPLTLPSVLHFSIDMWMVSMIVSNWVVLLLLLWRICWSSIHSMIQISIELEWTRHMFKFTKVKCPDMLQVELNFHIMSWQNECCIHFNVAQPGHLPIFSCCSKMSNCDSSVDALFAPKLAWQSQPPKLQGTHHQWCNKKSPRAVVVGLLVTCTLPPESSDDALSHQPEIHNSDSEVWLVSHWESISICTSALCIPMRHV